MIRQRWNKKGINLKVGFMIILYYSIITLVFFAEGSPLQSEGYTSSVDLNSSVVNDPEDYGEGGFVPGSNVLSKIGDFLVFAVSGIGLPGDTPTFVQFFISTFFIGFSLFTLFWIIGSIWNG